ncbi:uncharacterized protein LOC141534225 isoform X2 [Cotesia typhae]|uniref:uncharacterized protein LOC141534225 isoform X2 n=1 Tax=Cotesia typhae TaxID=2053667 RepID=UPI003D686263
MNADVLLDLGGKNVDVRWRSIKFSTFVLQREMLLMNLDLLIFSTKVAEFITDISRLLSQGMTILLDRIRLLQSL